MSIFDKVVLINLIMFLAISFFDSVMFDDAIEKMMMRFNLLIILNGWTVVTCMSIPTWISVSIFNL